jgi:hypothetical protein
MVEGAGLCVRDDVEPRQVAARRASVPGRGHGIKLIDPHPRE